MPRIIKFLEDHIDLTHLDMVSDPVTYRSPEGAVTTEVAAVQRGVRWKWHRPGESGIGEVSRAHGSLLAAWKAMDNLSEDL